MITVHRAMLRVHLVAAALFLTRLKLPAIGPWPTGTEVRSMWAFPLVGAGIGLIAGGGGALMLALGAPSLLAAAVCLTLAVLITGGLHEDGLADFWDGIGGGTDPARRLEIMRDSRLGAFGGLAIALALALRLTALGAQGAPGPFLAASVLAAAGSRAVLPACLALLPAASRTGLAAAIGRPGLGVWATALGLGLGLAGLLAVFGPVAPANLLAAMLLAALLLGWLIRLARDRLGGITGDVLGAVQQVVEVSVLIGLALRIEDL